MNATTLDGQAIELPGNLVAGLATRIKGLLLVPGVPGYDDARTVWNAMIDRRPAFVVRCLGTADVLECVRFAREHRLLVCIKGGGHNIAGLAAADGAMMIDLSAMRGVVVHPKQRIAHAQAGCLLGDVDRETQLHGLATALGFVSMTGIAGLTLGGGFGYLSRRFGWTSDNVVGMNVVTADARIVRASADDNPDLFWGLCGGGGNFGVVTGIDYVLHPVGPEIVGGMVAWPASDAPQVLEHYRTLSEESGPELTLVAILRPAPPAPWLPKAVHGTPIVALLACHTGPVDDAERDVARIKGFGRPVGDVLVRRPYTQLQSLLDATQPKGRRYYWKSEYLPRVDEALCARAIEHAGRIRSPHSAVIVFQIGDAVARLAANHSAAANRDARYVFNVAGAWERPEDDAANVQWARDAWDDLKAFSTGGNYVNFLTEDEPPERVRAALGPAVQRLAQVKRRWDPENVFRANRNVTPR